MDADAARNSAPCTFPFSARTLGLLYCLMYGIDIEEEDVFGERMMERFRA